jgi:hypothetical protein
MYSAPLLILLHHGIDTGVIVVTAIGIEIARYKKRVLQDL